MNKNLWWKVGLIVGILVLFSVAIVPTKSNPEPINGNDAASLAYNYVPQTA